MPYSKSLFMLLLVMIGGPALGAEGAEIREVTVFENRARVGRALEAEIPAGVSEVRFEELTATLTEPSVTARVDGAEVLGIRLEWQYHETDVRVEVAELEERLRAKLDESFELAQRAQIAGKMKGLTGGYAGHLEKSLADFGVGAGWQQSSELFLAAEARVARWRVEAANEFDDVERQRKELSRAIQKIRYDLQQLNARSGRTTRTAVVIVEAEQSGAREVALSYDVPRAHWTPVYEARLDEGQGQVEFSMRAAVHQHSGEDWSDVRLSLSTARSSLGLVAPTLTPLRVSGHAISYKPSVGVAEKKMDEQLGILSDDEELEEDLATGEDLSRAIVRSGRGPVTFEIRVPATVPSDGQPHQVSIHADRYPAELGYEAIPRVKPHVYRRARFDNDSPLPLLPGLVHVFRESAFVGDTQLPAVAPGESIKMYFGVEGRITAGRHEVRRKVEDAGTFTSDRLITIGHRFDLHNFTGEAVDVFLIDAIPVSELEDVVVSLTKRTEPAVTNRKKDGTVEWKIRLEPSRKRSVQLEYQVRHPADTPLSPDWFQ